MSYFHKYDPFPMTSPEALALESSISNDLREDPSSSSVGEFRSVYDGDRDEYCSYELNEAVWESMDTTCENRGPSDAAVKRLRGGGGSGMDVNQISLLNTGTRVDTSPAAVLDDIDTDQQGRDLDDEENDEDEFLDRPTYESRAKGSFGKALIAAGKMGEKLVRRLYGDTLSIDEFLRIVTLASTLFFMIGGYWLMRSLKDPVITALCGVSVIPKAKILSVFVVLCVVSVYNHLLDTDIPKHKLFYLFGTFYFLVFAFIGTMLYHPIYGLPNEAANPNRILGWVSYCSIESFGSVMVTLFWSFANSNISLETAKASYGLMVAIAQVGSIIGPTFVKIFARRLGVPTCYLIGSLSMLLLQASMFMYIQIYGVNFMAKRQIETKIKMEPSTSTTLPKKKEKPGILEGLKLLYSHHYVKGIFAISCFFMVEVTILDYTMKALAVDYFGSKYPSYEGEGRMSQQATEEFTTFMGLFGQSTNMLSFTLSLFGTSAVIRILGLRLTLLLFPSLCLAVIIFVRFYPTLYVVFGAMMILKANSYALNNPTKEILYQPTSPAVKYKAKSWIDIFGDRVSKAVGSLITNAFSNSTDNLIANGSIVGMAVATFLIWNATFMGRKFDEYMESGYVVGGDNSAIHTASGEDADTSHHVALKQNDNADTSCAIIDETAITATNTTDVSSDLTSNLEGEGDGKDFAKKPDVVMV